MEKRAEIFMTAAEMISKQRRMDVMATTMLGQVCLCEETTWFLPSCRGGALLHLHSILSCLKFTQLSSQGMLKLLLILPVLKFAY